MSLQCLLAVAKRHVNALDQTLLEVAKVQRLDRPRDKDIEAIRQLRDEIAVHDSFKPGWIGEERKAWADNLYDLITVNPVINKDLFQELTTMVLKKVCLILSLLSSSPSLTRENKQREEKRGHRHEISERIFETLVGESNAHREWVVVQISAWIAMIIAAALPGALVLILYRINSVSTRLYALIGFTVGFTIAARILTPANRIELFGATAA